MPVSSAYADKRCAVTYRHIPVCTGDGHMGLGQCVVNLRIVFANLFNVYKKGQCFCSNSL